MKKILIFIPDISANGICKVIADYIKRMDCYRNIEILTFYIENDMYFDKEIKINELGKTKSIFKRIIRETRFLKNNNCSLIHINGNYCSRIIECFAAKLSKVDRIILHSHNAGVGNNKRIKIILHKVLRKCFDFLADEYIACSNEAAKWMFSKKIYKNKQYVVLNNGIELNKYKFNINKRNEIRKELKISTNSFVAGFVGRLSYQKNPIFLVKIADECHKQNIDLKFLVIGDGNYKDDMFNRLEELRLDKNFIFLGNINNANDYYNVMDVFLFPSKYEGLGIVAIEAQTNGLKSLISDKVPKECEVSDLVSFLPINTNDSVQKWVSKIQEEYNSVQKNDRCKYAKIVKDHGYDINIVAKELEKIYLNN